MTPETAARFCERYGQPVLVRRITQAGTAAIPFDAAVPAPLRSYRADELVGGIVQGDRQAIVSHRHLQALQWPVPPRDGAQADRVIVGGKPWKVEKAEERRGIAGEVVDYVLTIRGIA